MDKWKEQKKKSLKRRKGKPDMRQFGKEQPLRLG